MARFLVTGGTGQIGAYVCESLLNGGHSVVCYDFKPNMENIARISSRMKVVSGDVTELGTMARLMKESGVTHVIHLAASLVFDSLENPTRAYRTNVMGTNNVFEAMRLMDVQRTVFASSISVYGSPRSRRPGIVDEDDYPNCPDDPYATTKLAAELMGQYYRGAYGLDIVCLRLAAAWGPGRYWGYTGQLNDFIRKAAVGEDATFPDDFSYREAKMRWFYVKDMGRCFAHAAQVPRGAVKRYLYNAGLGEPFRGEDVVTALRAILPERRLGFRAMDSPTKISSTIAGPSGLDIDCARMHTDLGFSPEFPLGAALKDMVDYERAKADLPAI